MSLESGKLFHICGDCNFFSPDISLNLSLNSDLPGDCLNHRCFVEKTRGGWTPAEAHDMLAHQYPSRFPNGLNDVVCSHDSTEYASCYMDSKIEKFLNSIKFPKDTILL